jgi:hypothetical protein
MVYDQNALLGIADAIGPCLEGRDHGEMLECIEREGRVLLVASQDYNARPRATMVAQLEAAGAGDDLLEYIRKGGQDLPIEPRPSATHDRDTLLAAAAALRDADRLLADLGPIGAGHLALEEVERGLKVRPAEYLADLADAAAAAAGGLRVKTGPERSAVDRFICALNNIVEYFAGWHAASTHTRVFIDAPDDAPLELVMKAERTASRYGGKFVAVVKACAEPLGIKKSDSAWDRAIRRAFGRDKLTA